MKSRKEFAEEESTEDREKSVDMGEGKEESKWGQRPIRESLENSEDLEDREREMSDESFDRESKDEEKSGEDWEGEEKPRKQKPDSGADELEQPKENEVSENALTVAVLEADEGSDLSKDQKSEKQFSREERVHDLMKN